MLCFSLELYGHKKLLFSHSFPSKGSFKRSSLPQFKRTEGRVQRCDCVVFSQRQLEAIIYYGGQWLHILQLFNCPGILLAESNPEVQLNPISAVSSTNKPDFQHGFMTLISIKVARGLSFLKKDCKGYIFSNICWTSIKDDFSHVAHLYDE